MILVFSESESRNDNNKTIHSFWLILSNTNYNVDDKKVNFQISGGGNSSYNNCDWSEFCVCIVEHIVTPTQPTTTTATAGASIDFLMNY